MFVSFSLYSFYVKSFVQLVDDSFLSFKGADVGINFLVGYELKNGFNVGV